MCHKKGQSKQLLFSFFGEIFFKDKHTIMYKNNSQDSSKFKVCSPQSPTLHILTVSKHFMRKNYK